ncbi:unnamed protein product [Rhizophagus irregularis]|uniref:Uncharacterized protein n=1 Tax=Rhizophagus irregularis TaxID=588596 RepID=A0A916E5M5_9GLOM|nr:unnamed protein product [Rhizophagus irregularis]CAB5209062.1 unnamed protein product [Rhizophagus irregularis]CAB5361419.1 unnamed protein product [Rhizophagus irregularis]
MRDRKKGKVVELFKEIAAREVSDAKLDMCLEEFLTMAADNENTAAQLNLGDLFFNGKLDILKNEEKVQLNEIVYLSICLRFSISD